MTSTKKLIEAVIRGKSARRVVAEALSPKALLAAGKAFNTKNPADLNKARISLQQLLDAGAVVKVMPYSITDREGPFYTFMNDGQGNITVYHDKRKLVKLKLDSGKQFLELIRSAGETDRRGNIILSFDNPV